MEKLDALKSCPLLADVSLENLGRDCPTGRVFVFRHRSIIYRQGDHVQDVFCLLDGQMTLARVSREGESLTTAMLGAGELFGPVLSGLSEAEDTATSKGEVFVWRVPRQEFQRLLLRYPEVSWKLVSILARRQRQLERRLEGFAFKQTEARLAEMFRELSGGFATRCEHGFGQHLCLTQQELADLVGASRPVVSTILNRLRDKGVLGYNREYVCVRRIEDIEALIDS